MRANCSFAVDLFFDSLDVRAGGILLNGSNSMLLTGCSIDHNFGGVKMTGSAAVIASTAVRIKSVVFMVPLMVSHRLPEGRFQ